MTDPGRLKTRLVLQAPQETPDGQGGVTRGFVDVARLWASVVPLAAREDVEADAHGASVRCRIILRNEFDLTLRHRLIEGARSYRIIALRERDDRRFIEIDAELRQE